MCWYLWSLISVFFCSCCLDGIDTEVAVCTIPCLLQAFEAEQNGRTTLKISFVMTSTVIFNFQIIIPPALYRLKSSSTSLVVEIFRYCPYGCDMPSIAQFDTDK